MRYSVLLYDCAKQNCNAVTHSETKHDNRTNRQENTRQRKLQDRYRQTEEKTITRENNLARNAVTQTETKHDNRTNTRKNKHTRE